MESGRMIPSSRPSQSTTMIKRNRCGRTTGSPLAASMLWFAPIAPRPAAPPPSATPANYAQRPEVRAFIAELAADKDFDARALRRLFAQARRQPRVVAAMSRPVVSPPKWYEFAPRFLDPARVAAGVVFWHGTGRAPAPARDGFRV